MKKTKIIVCFLFLCILLSACKSNYYDDPEEVPLIKNSIDELIDAIKDAKLGKAQYGNNIAELDSIIIPDFDDEGYYLFQVEVNDNYFFYYYVPDSLKPEEAYIHHGRDLIVTVCRSKNISADNPLEPLTEQLHIMPDEDGFLFNGDQNDLTFAYENTWVCFEFPDTYQNYDEMKKMCKVKTIEIK